ncbi:MAG: bacillithiol biosynthesis deacetylase BshB1 [Bacteroidetes bacterium]|nr:MAG: bacillithiol biosynthesis deacetylase BshB1 [Bacteroidota bacterium]TNF00079.1 MAG: bacillithiol biosynthesis deacetylase BshB1 [Bacteroidota bacterium]
MELDILAFAAHPDDVELSASATLMHHIEKGYKVGIVDLTEGELGSRGTVETRYAEAKDASEIMGLSERVNLQMADGFFEINELNKRLIIEQIRRFRPKVVLANAISDRHPDHGRAAKLVSEAAYYAGLTKIATEWEGAPQKAFRPQAVYHYIQDYSITPDFVVDATPYVERKMRAITAFKTQFYDPANDGPQTPISGKDFLDFILSRMRHFGRPAGYEYAEGFTVERYPGVQDFFDLD